MNAFNDHATIHPSKVNHGGEVSNHYVIREWARDLRCEGFNPQQGDMLVFDNSLGVTSQEELVNLITNIYIEADNLIVNFGNDVTITLPGVQPDQISWDNVLVGDPGATDPGATDPGTTDPGATDPGATDPGATDPGATDPGATDPSATDPGATDPGATDPGATDPGATDPGATDPGATDPSATDPGATDPGATDPGATDPGATDPGVVDPIAAEPGQNIVCNPGELVQGGDGSDNFVFNNLGHWTINNFNASEDRLDLTEYGLSREEIASYITNIQIMADNLIINFGDDVSITLAGAQPDQIGWDDVIVDDPAATDPGATDPGATDPGATDPGATDPGATDPGATDPGATDPGATDPGATDPGATDPGVVDPIATDPGQNIDCNPGDSVLGGDGSDNFVFHNLGHWTINNFNASDDMLDLTEYGLSREEVASHITNIQIEADNFIVNFGDDVSITLVGQPPTWDNVTTVEG